MWPSSKEAQVHGMNNDQPMNSALREQYQACYSTRATVLGREQYQAHATVPCYSVCA